MGENPSISTRESGMQSCNQVSVNDKIQDSWYSLVKRVFAHNSSILLAHNSSILLAIEGMLLKQWRGTRAGIYAIIGIALPPPPFVFLSCANVVSSLLAVSPLNPVSVGPHCLTNEKEVSPLNRWNISLLRQTVGSALQLDEKGQRKITPVRSTLFVVSSFFHTANRTPGQKMQSDGSFLSSVVQFQVVWRFHMCSWFPAYPLSCMLGAGLWSFHIP